MGSRKQRSTDELLGDVSRTLLRACSRYEARPEGYDNSILTELRRLSSATLRLSVQVAEADLESQRAQSPVEAAPQT